MKTYTGIADAHGIESFREGQKNRTDFKLKLRASLNRQRHALVYQADLDEAEVERVEALINEHQYKEALTYLKTRHSFAVEEGMQSSAKMIPNDDLDPYWK